MNAPVRRLYAPGTADAVRASPEGMRKYVEIAVEEGGPWTGDLGCFLHWLHEVARVDLCLARLVEGHADAVRILREAGARPRDGLYGVWASRSARTGVLAEPAAQGHHLTGEVRFASGVGVVDRALVPGLRDGDDLLFDVPVDGVEADPATWQTAAMDASRSYTVHVAVTTKGAPLGPPGFYLDRPGFAVGGLGVAAVWVGGARSVVDLVAAGLREFDPDAHQSRRVGAMEQFVWQADAALRHAAAAVSRDQGRVDVAGEVGRARTAVVAACEHVVEEAGRVVGPGGLTRNGRLARTLADLTLYVRQHHVDRTLEALGRDALHSAEVAG